MVGLNLVINRRIVFHGRRYPTVFLQELTLNINFGLHRWKFLVGKCRYLGNETISDREPLSMSSALFKAECSPNSYSEHWLLPMQCSVIQICSLLMWSFLALTLAYLCILNSVVWNLGVQYSVSCCSAFRPVYICWLHCSFVDLICALEWQWTEYQIWNNCIRFIRCVLRLLLRFCGTVVMGTLYDPCGIDIDTSHMTKKTCLTPPNMSPSSPLAFVARSPFSPIRLKQFNNN